MNLTAAPVSQPGRVGGRQLMTGSHTDTVLSGAEHDAALIAQKVPAAMLFVPSASGRSHCPEEWTDLDDIMPGVTALTETLRRLDRTRRS